MPVPSLVQAQQLNYVGPTSGTNTSGVSVDVSNGTCTVTGSAGDDKIEARQQPHNKNMVDIVVNGQVIKSVPRWQIETLRVNGGDGNDQIKVGPGLGMKVTIDGGAGDDAIINYVHGATIICAEGNDTVNGKTVVYLHHHHHNYPTRVKA